MKDNSGKCDDGVTCGQTPVEPTSTFAVAKRADHRQPEKIQRSRVVWSQNDERSETHTTGDNRHNGGFHTNIVYGEDWCQRTQRGSPLLTIVPFHTIQLRKS